MQECKDHYLRTYVDAEGAPAPRTAPALAGLTMEQLMKRPVEPCRPPEEAPAAKTSTSAALPAVASTSNITGAADPKPAASAEGAAVDDAAAADGPPRKRAGRPPKKQRTREKEDVASGSGTASEDMDAEDEASAGDGAAAAEPSDKPAAAAESRKDDSNRSGGGGGGGGAAAAAAGRARDAIKHEATGYLKLRDEFEPEYDAEAELPIADLDFLPTDSAEVRAGKLRMLEIYNERLKERERRREIVKAKGCAPRL